MFVEGGGSRQPQRSTILPPLRPEAWTFGAPEGELEEVVNYLKGLNGVNMNYKLHHNINKKQYADW